MYAKPSVPARMQLILSRPLTGNKHQNNTRVSAETVRQESTYIISFLTRHNQSINYDRNGDHHTSSPCLTRSFFVLLMTSQSIADDVTMTKNCDAITWIMISNSLDIDFVHGRSCKKMKSQLWQWRQKWGPYVPTFRELKCVTGTLFLEYGFAGCFPCIMEDPPVFVSLGPAGSSHYSKSIPITTWMIQAATPTILKAIGRNFTDEMSCW